MDDRAAIDERAGSRPVRSRRWRRLAVIGIALLLAAAGAVWWLGHGSDGDLLRIRAAAGDLHIATTSADMGAVLAPADRLARWNRLAALAKELKSYSASTSWTPSTALILFDPVPAGLRAHHAMLDAAKMDELLGLIDALGDDPLILRTEYSFSSLQPEIGVQRALANLLKERLALADGDQVDIEAARMLTLCLAYDTKNLISILVKASITSIALQGITRRLADLRRRGSGIPELIDRCSARLAVDFARGLEGEFAACLEFFAHPPPAGGVSLSSAGWLPAGNPWDAMLTSVDMSLGRETVLRLELDWVQHARASSDPSSLMRLARACAEDHKGIQPGMMRMHLAGLIAPVYEGVIPMVFGAILHARLLSAELRGKPWPTDDFDPTHALLRSVVRDGQLCGAYSLYKGGEDLHGHRPNQYFALYGPLDPPRPVPLPKP